MQKQFGCFKAFLDFMPREGQPAVPLKRGFCPCAMAWWLDARGSFKAWRLRGDIPGGFARSVIASDRCAFRVEIVLFLRRYRETQYSPLWCIAPSASALKRGEQHPAASQALQLHQLYIQYDGKA